MVADKRPVSKAGEEEQSPMKPAGKKSDPGGSSSGNGEETDKRKRPMRFSGQHDIRLLQEVVSLNPFKDTPPTTTWASISKNLEHLFTISSRRCRERTILLLDQFIKGDYPSLQRYCSKEEFAIKEQLLQQVLQQYEDGAGGYSSRIGGGFVTAAAAAAEEEDEDDDFDPEKARPRVILQEDSTSEPYTAKQGSNEQEQQAQNGTPSAKEQATPSAKRARLVAPSPFSISGNAIGNGNASNGGLTDDDEGGLEDIAMAAAMGDVKPSDFPSQVVSFLLTRQAKEMRVREKELKLRREELDLERAKLKLQEDRLALEKARFEIERQERELRLRSERQERTLFMEVLKRVVSSGFADS